MGLGKGLSGAASGAAAGSTFGPVGSVIGGIGGFLGGLFGGGGPSPEEIAAENLKRAYESTIVATPEQRRIQLQYLKSVGQLTPEQEQEILQQDTEMQSINIDPRLKDAQMQALRNLEQQGKEGLTLEDRTALMEAQRQAAQQSQGQQEAILQNMEARGMGGSGAELAARLQASQGGADAAAQRGLQIAAQAQKARMDALARAGSAAGSMAQSEFQRQADVKSAQDVINRFNVGSRQNVQQRNVAGRNQAQQYNLDYARDLEQNRVGTMNKQAEINRDASLDYYDALNQRTLGAAGADVRYGAPAQTQRRQREDAGFAETMGGIGATAKAAKDAYDYFKKPKVEGGGVASKDGGGVLSGLKNLMTPGE